MSRVYLRLDFKHYSMPTEFMVLWLMDMHAGKRQARLQGAKRLRQKPRGIDPHLATTPVSPEWIAETYLQVTGQPIPELPKNGTPKTGGFDISQHIEPETPVVEPKEFQPSKYQEAIFDWIENGTGNGFCDARAGSGKTTTLIEVAKRCDVAGLVLMFSKRMEVENTPKFAGTSFRVQTSHSLGNAAVRSVYKRTEFNKKKYDKYVYNLLDQVLKTGHLAGQRVEDWTLGILNEQYPKGEILKLIRLCQATLTDTSDRAEVLKVAAHYGVDLHPSLAGFCAWAVDLCLQRGIKEAPMQIDFSDMVWLPCVVRGMNPQRYPMVLIDEAQDLTAAQRTLAGMACTDRSLFVGDRYQSIFGFAGADTASIDRIIEEFQCTTLPLSICYRCPTSHLDLARRLVPDIENAPGAIVGEVHHITEDDLPDRVKQGSLIMCRLTAPIISCAYMLIRNKISARVIGRDIGAGILALLKRVRKQEKVFKFSDLIESIDDYGFNEETLILASNENDTDDPKIQSLRDKCECLTIIVRCSEAETFDDLTWAIKDLFKDGKATVDLSTVHRAKGLEAADTYILRPDLMPSPFAAKPWQQEQEKYLEYVALTRSTYSLSFVA